MPKVFAGKKNSSKFAAVSQKADEAAALLRAKMNDLYILKR